MIPYGRQYLDQEDIDAVVEVLRSDWLTTGPRVQAFEEAVATYVGARFGVAVSSGTAALHCAMHALGIGPGDEVILPPMTFAATANSVLYLGGTPVFADVDPETLLLDPVEAAGKVTGRTKAIIGVDYAGRPCDYDALREVADSCGARQIADACHSLGARCNCKPAGSWADLAVFSFHPVKHITTGEGGMVVTNDPAMAHRIRCFRNHGITTDHREREEKGAWHYEQQTLGFNYRITDIQCALGISQLKKLDAFLQRRGEIACLYDEAFTDIPEVVPVGRAGLKWATHAHHLYVIRVPQRDTLFRSLREKGIGVNVHYLPVYHHPYYRDVLGYAAGLCPVAERAADEVLSLPMWPGLKDAECRSCIDSLLEISQLQ